MERKRGASDIDVCSEYLHIADYAVIGDCHTAALIGKNGSIDWYCPGRFDAPAVFCRLLDHRRGGYFCLAPSGQFSAHRQYRGATNVLQTEFTAAGGSVRVADLMPIKSQTEHRRGADVSTSRQILRLVEGLGGEVEIELSFKPTFGYANGTTTLSLAGCGAIAHANTQFITLSCPDFKLEQAASGEIRGRFQVQSGQRSWLILTDSFDLGAARRCLECPDCEGLMADTVDYWEKWAAECTYEGPYRRQVLRSALTLKLLTYEPTGALVAAPTTSLPEEIGGTRNWDYRFSWLRDSSLILNALMTIGYHEEAADYLRWVESVLRADSKAMPQIVYAIDGRRNLNEVQLDYLEGYRCSRPVRIGNAAVSQEQLDIFGDLLVGAYLNYGRQGLRASGGVHTKGTRQSERFAKAVDRDAKGRGQGDRPPLPPQQGPAREGTGGAVMMQPPEPQDWLFLRGLVEQAAQRWKEPDRSIWEIRGPQKPYVYSRVMCWAALDRGIRLAEEYGLPAPLERWRQVRDAIRKAILTHGVDHAQGNFTQAFDSAELDASALIIPRIGFLPATDPRMQSTIKRIQEVLMENGLVRRYLGPDGLPGRDGAFVLCTLWLADALALSGHQEQARDVFERVLSCTNDVGLLSEEIAPKTREMLGNFPQGFTHMALMSCAVDLDKTARHGPEERPEAEGERAHRARRAHRAVAQQATSNTAGGSS